MLVAAVVHDVLNFPISHEKRIGEQLPMAAPGDGFGAHESDAPLGRDGLHLCHNLFEFRCQHEVGVGAKGADPPSGVHRIRRRFAKAAEVTAPQIIDAIFP